MQQRPTLDDETMKLWNAWLDARCKAMINSALREFSFKLIKTIALKVRAENLKLRAEIEQLRKDMVVKDANNVTQLPAFLRKARE